MGDTGKWMIYVTELHGWTDKWMTEVMGEWIMPVNEWHYWENDNGWMDYNVWTGWTMGELVPHVNGWFECVTHGWNAHECSRYQI